ncbi:hypothetical protein HK098_000788 [Nowakowskiella sp. JEL0407]|nr:hypothetical protein HK098_000788 [Nowakowskiella sp. JEL0407]
MLVLEEFADVETSSGPMRVHLFIPNTGPEYPNAKFPGVAVWTEIYQVTGPLERFCRQIASEGYLVACNESFHEFEPLGSQIPYDVEGTDRGNLYKIKKELQAYDEDATLTLNVLESHPNCNGKLGSVGMCLGGHLSFRAAFDKRVKSAVCYFATDIHKKSLGAGMNDDSLERCSEITGELLFLWGKKDTHVPVDGRQLIYNRLTEANLRFSWCEFVDAQHAFIRDELSKGRYDAALARNCFSMMMEVFHRTLYVEYGPLVGKPAEVEHVC